MSRKIIAKILCLGLSLGLFAGTTDAAFAAESTANTGTAITVNQEAAKAAREEAAKLREEAKQKEDAAVKNLYSLQNNGAYSRFTNYVHGYSLNVDNDTKADMSYSGVCAVLENDHKRIEIYKESLAPNVSQQAYISYSNQFLANTADHTKEYDTRTTISGRSVHILQWSRQKLSRVENDKNYYVSLEILSGSKEIYTIFVKSDTPFYLTGGYNYLVSDFNTFAPTQSAYMRKTVDVPPESKGWNQET